MSHPIKQLSQFSRSNQDLRAARRKIQELHEHIKRLEEAGDEMCSEFKAFCPLGSKTRDKWRKAKEAKL